MTLCRVKTESEDPVSCAESVSPGRILGSSTDGAGKRTAAQTPPDGPNAELDQNTATKRMKVSTEVRAGYPEGLEYGCTVRKC